jgi:fibronectin-binding autotransporter adhesin
LIGDLTGCIVTGIVSGITSGVSPGLAPLADNGGPTPTHALLPGSPALDRGDGGCAPVDQRGVPRPQDARCDLGAFEQRTRASSRP